MAVANSRISVQHEEIVQICEFATAITQNLSDLDCQPWISKLLKMTFLVRLGSLTVLR